MVSAWRPISLLLILAPLVSSACRCGLDTSAIDDLRCSELEPCAVGLECRDGYCQAIACDAGEDPRLCGSDCVDMYSDPLHCGGCNQACGAARDCVEGNCVCSDDELTPCGDECVRTSTDPANCGGCEVRCSDGTVCQSGACEAGCDDPLTYCEGSCVDLWTDRLNCGDCFMYCDLGQFCDLGVCSACARDDDCDDQLDCTVDRCDARSCSNDLAQGACLIAGTCRSAGERNPGDGCLACRPDLSPVSWSEDLDDDIPCTLDSCEGGAVAHEPRDEECDEGQACAPCAGGCVVPPTLALECDDAEAAAGGPDATCHLQADGDFPAACYACSSLVGMTSLVLEHFDDCSLAERGWIIQSGAPGCPLEQALSPNPAVEPALEADDASWVIERRVNTADFDRVRVCFDWGATRVATTTEYLQLEVQTEGPSWVWIFGGEGRRPDAANTWFTECFDLADLEPAAAGNPDLGLKFTAVSDSSEKDIYLDQIAVDGWVDGDLGDQVSFNENFTGCALDDWDVDELGGPQNLRCPVDQVAAGVGWNDLDAVQADDAIFRLSRTADASEVCEDLVLSFDYGASRTDGDELFVLELDAGGGFAYEWGNEASTLGGAGPIDELATIVRNLSHRDPSVRFRPDLGIRFGLTSDGNDRHLVLDDIELGGKTCGPAGDRVTIGDLLAAPGGDGYTFTVGSATQLTAYPVCTWDERPAIFARGRVVLLRP